MKNERLELYELLLQTKAKLEKECEHLSLEYTREFGDELVRIFELKVECITLKKKIAFCVKKKNKNQTIYADELENFIDAEILKFQDELEDLIEYNKNVKVHFANAIAVPFEDNKKIKKLYHAIAHMIHPDLHPELIGNLLIEEIWEKTVDAYRRNLLDVLKECYDHILLLVKDKEDIEIENLEEKIKKLEEEIKDIKEHEPYKYKFMLKNEVEVAELHEEFNNQIRDYEEYKETLLKELSSFNIINRCEA